VLPSDASLLHREVESHQALLTFAAEALNRAMADPSSSLDVMVDFSNALRAYEARENARLLRQIFERERP